MVAGGPGVLVKHPGRYPGCALQPVPTISDYDPPMTDAVRGFYDGLAAGYHLLFADWQASVRHQGAVLDRVIRTELGVGPHAILDCACGIGTQAIGLALAGHRLHATDLSPVAVERARREATSFGAILSLGVADMQTLAEQVPGTFNVVLACDNALPHLLTDEDVRQALASMAAKLRPGGLFLASIRDYDQIVRDRPGGEGPRVIDDADGRRIAFQVWDWADDGHRYRLHQFLVRQTDDGWQTDHFDAEYRALLRDDLAVAVHRAGLVDVRWHEPKDSGYYQPIVTALKR